MTQREQFQNELWTIEGLHEKDITPAKQKRARQIIKMLNECICRNCAKKYNLFKSRSEYQGFCSAKCQHVKSKSLGCKKGDLEYTILKNAKCVGSVFVVN